MMMNKKNLLKKSMTIGLFMVFAGAMLLTSCSMIFPEGMTDLGN